jgi:hypothetical protein
MDLFDLPSRMTEDVKSPDFQICFPQFNFSNYMGVSFSLDILFYFFHSVLCSGSDSLFLIL